MEDSGVRPGFSNRTVNVARSYTLNQLTTIIQSLPFKYSEGEASLGWQPARTVSVSIEYDEDNKCWWIHCLQFIDQWGEILFHAQTDVIDGPVLLTKRGEQKTYASLSALRNDVIRLVGERGSIRIHEYFSNVDETEVDEDE